MAEFYPSNTEPKIGNIFDPSALRIENDQFKYNINPLTYNYTDIFKRAIKYLFEGLAVAFVAHTFTKGKLELREVLMLGVTAAFVFAILDTFSPTISLGARFGAGFGVGQSIFGVGPAALL